jgi:AcrR family transcriptional regulator
MQDRGRPRSKALQERSRTTRARILEITATLAMEQDIDDVSVDQICRAAGIAKGTFYFHFPTKDDLLLAVFFQGSETLIDEVQPLIEGEVPFDAAVAKVVERVATRTSAFPKSFVAKAAGNAVLHAGRPRPEGAPPRRPPREALRRLIHAAQQRGELRSDYRPDELAMALNWALLQGLLVWSSLPGARPSLETVLRRRVELALHGMSGGPAPAGTST